MHIAYATNNRYLKPMVASIASVIENCKGSLHFYILHSEITPSALDEITDHFSCAGVDFTFYNMTEDLLQQFTLPEAYHEAFNYFTPEIYYRLFLPELLPTSVSKIIYLDCDTIVLDNIEHLWEIDLKSKMIAAVIEPFSPNDPIGFRYNHLCDLDITDYYFNSGVLILNLDLIRKRNGNLLEDAVKIIDSYPVCFPDQDILNKLFQHNTLFLQPKYNSMCCAGDPMILNFFRYFILSGRECPYTEAMILEAVNKPSILHFFGKYKPWHQPGIYFNHKELFWRYYNKTPYRTEASSLIENVLLKEAKQQKKQPANF